MEEVCQKIITNFDFTQKHAQDTETSVSDKKRRGKRWSTESWLEEIIEKFDVQFKDFISISFHKPNKDIVDQSLLGKHIKKVILDFFYPYGKKPKDRIRLWFFTERHQTGNLHLHILMESMDGLSWLLGKNRKLTLSKNTLFNIIADEDYIIDDVIIECLTNHLKTYIKKLGNGKKSTNFKKIGEVKTRVNYVNKSLETFDFDGWEHIDFENSDL